MRNGQRVRWGVGCAVMLALIVAMPWGATVRGADSTSAAKWTVVGTPQRATITGGPWTLGQGPSSGANPVVGYPEPNPGTQAFQPYYFPKTYGDTQTIDGLFDYRPRNVEEQIVTAHSDDGGRSWRYTGQSLRYLPSATPDPENGNDDGQGHPFMLSVGNAQFLYTLDRQAGLKNVVGLNVRRFSDGAPLDVNVFPQNETPPSTTMQTTGLLNPDGIIDVIPGMQPPTVMYLQKQLGSTPVKDVTTLRLANTTDGINFTDLGAATGILDKTSLFIGPRGTIMRYGTGDQTRYGLFFSAGTLVDQDSDAFHYIGYAESSDLKTWTVVNGVDNPILSRDKTDSAGGPQPWYEGRVYSPSVTFSADGKTGTLVFAGYNTPKPKDNLGDYRTIGVVTLTRA